MKNFITYIIFCFTYLSLYTTDVYACKDGSQDSVILMLDCFEYSFTEIPTNKDNIFCFEKQDTLVIWTSDTRIFNDTSIWYWDNGIKCVQHLCNKLNPSTEYALEHNFLNIEYLIGVPSDLIISTLHDTVRFISSHHLGLALLSNTDTDTILTPKYCGETRLTLSSFIITDTILNYMGIHIGTSQKHICEDILNIRLKRTYSHIVITCTNLSLLNYHNRESITLKNNPDFYGMYSIFLTFSEGILQRIETCNINLKDRIVDLGWW